MIIYVEKKIKNNQITQNIISLFKEAQVLEIDNYKNIFDKNISGSIEKNIVLAEVKNAITQTPENYGHI